MAETKQLINPEGTDQYYETWQMSQAVRVGNTVWLSGEVGLGEDGEIVDGIEAQTRQAFRNIEATLNEAGCVLNDVVELITYHVSMEDLDVFRRVKSEFIRRDFPAWTAVGVTELYTPEALIEIKVTAIAGSGSGS